MKRKSPIRHKVRSLVRQRRSINYLTLVVLFLLLTVIVSFSNKVYAGGEVLIDSFTTFSTYYDLGEIYPGVMDPRSMQGQALTISDNYKLTSIRFSLARRGSPTGTLKVFVFGSTGTVGTNARPNVPVGGPYLAISGGIDVGTFTPGWIVFTFSGINQITLLKSVSYCFGIAVVEGSLIPGVNEVRVGCHSSGNHAGNHFYERLGSFITTGGATNDTMFMLYGEKIFSPTIGQFNAPSIIAVDEYFNLEAVINDVDGIANFKNTTIEISQNIILKWLNSTNIFSEFQDLNNVCVLDVSGSIRETINSTAYRLKWRIKLSIDMPKGYVSVIAANTKVYDANGLSGSGSEADLFYFKGLPITKSIQTTAQILAVLLSFITLCFGILIIVHPKEYFNKEFLSIIIILIILCLFATIFAMWGY